MLGENRESHICIHIHTTTSAHISQFYLLWRTLQIIATATNATTALSVLAALVSMAPQQLSVASRLLKQLSANLINTALKQLLVLESCEYCSSSYH